MKTLDRYVLRGFLFSLLMWLVVMLTLRIMTDLFVNMDEFTERAEGFGEIVADIADYYAYQSLVYIAELGGVVVMAAAAFTVARMNHTNELTAMMASGVSLRRVLWPMILCSVVVSGLMAMNREVLIPRVASKLVRDRDDVPGTSEISVRFLTDGSQSVWYAPFYYPAERQMLRPTMILRDDEYRPLGRISGAEAYPGEMDAREGWTVLGDEEMPAVLAGLAESSGKWARPPSSRVIWTDITPGQFALASRLARRERSRSVSVADKDGGLLVQAREFHLEPPAAPGEPAGGSLEDVRFVFSTPQGRELARFSAKSARYRIDPDGGVGKWLLEEGRLFFPSDLTPEDIRLRQSRQWLEFLSVRQINELLKVKRVPDPRSALLTKHIRITEPLNGLVMLLVGVPFILSRERNVKASAFRCLAMVGAFYAFVYASRYIPSLPFIVWAPIPLAPLGIPLHVSFVELGPVWQAWLPVLVFGPIAAVLYDSIKT
jgi:lipopolysaccharide export system permease LptF/LptG-like protein